MAKKIAAAQFLEITDVTHPLIMPPPTIAAKLAKMNELEP